MRWSVLAAGALALACNANAQAPKKYALLVAVDQYEHEGFAKLECPRLDAEAFGAVLKGAGYEVDLLLGEQATKAAIEGKLEAFNGKGNAAGVALIGLFGHGVQPDDKSFFCPYDAKFKAVKDTAGNVLPDNAGKPQVALDPASLVGLEAVLAALAASPAGNRVLLADCCRNDPSQARGRDSGFGSSLAVNALPQNCAVVLACGKGERSFERKKNWGHGAFAKGLLDGLAALRSAGRPATLPALLDEALPKVTALVSKALYEQQTPRPLTTGRVDWQLANGAAPPEDIANSIGMKLRLIPPGEFMMGSDKGEDYEKPKHRVRITKAFYLGKYEVTQKEWKAVMRTEPWKGKEHVKEGDDYPAMWVSWDNATEYCGKLSAKEGVAYRLPSEAEWEYACRAGTTTEYGFGDNLDDLSDHAWWGFDGNGNTDNERYAHRVGQKKPNRFGLHDMHGNVSEWCGDWLGAKYYAESPLDDPRGPTTGDIRVFRGGGWHIFPQHSGSARRNGNLPDARLDDLGFRVARSSGQD